MTVQQLIDIKLSINMAIISLETSGNSDSFKVFDDEAIRLLKESLMVIDSEIERL